MSHYSDFIINLEMEGRRLLTQKHRNSSLPEARSARYGDIGDGTENNLINKNRPLLSTGIVPVQWM